MTTIVNDEFSRGDFFICVVVETFRFLGSQSESRAIKFLALVADHSPVAQQAVQAKLRVHRSSGFIAAAIGVAKKDYLTLVTTVI